MARLLFCCIVATVVAPHVPCHAEVASAKMNGAVSFSGDTAVEDVLVVEAGAWIVEAKDAIMIYGVANSEIEPTGNEL